MRYRLSEEDLANVLRGSSNSCFGMFLYVYVLLLALLALVGMYLIENDFGAIAWLWIGISVVIGVAAFEVPRIRARRSFKRNPSIQGEITGNILGQGHDLEIPYWRIALGMESLHNAQGNESGFPVVLLTGSFDFRSEERNVAGTN